SPESESVKAAQRFLDRLESSNVRVAGIVANRVRLWPEGAPPPDLDAADPAPLARALAAADGHDFPPERAARAAIDAAARYAALVRRDAAALTALREHAGRRGSFFRVVPEQSGDVHDLSGLALVAAALARESTSEAAERGEGMASSSRSGARPQVARSEPKA